MSNQYNGTGRRKTSVARVRILPGTGEFKVNKKDVSEYFAYDTLIEIAKSPLALTENEGKFDVFVNVKGGGFTGQAGAIRHGLSRALVEADEELKSELKTNIRRQLRIIDEQDAINRIQWYNLPMDISS